MKTIRDDKPEKVN